MKKIFVFALVLVGIFLLGCPREKYVGVPSRGVNIPLNTYSGILVAKLSAFDEEKKLYYSTFRPVPLKYPSSNVFVVKDIRDLKNIYNELKNYVPPAVREDNLTIRVGEEIVDYNFLKDKSAVLITFNPGGYEVSLSSAKAVEKDDKVYVDIEYIVSSSFGTKYPYLLVLFENPVRKDIQVSIVEKK